MVNIIDAKKLLNEPYEVGARYTWSCTTRVFLQLFVPSKVRGLSTDIKLVG